MDLLSSAAKADKTSYDYNARAMKVYLRMTRWTDAAEAAKAVRKLDPDDKKGDAAVACYVIACQGMDSKADNVKELLADVKKFDPTNEKGYFEKAYWQQAMDAYQAEQAAGVTDTLAELTGSAKKLANAQTIYGLLALGYAGQGQLDKADKTLDKAIATDPTSPVAQQLKAMQENIREKLKSK